MSVLRSASLFVVVSLAFGLLCACVGGLDRRVTLHPQAAGVEIVTGHPEGCRPLGDVAGSASIEGSQEQAVLEARNDVRNKAAALGATQVELQTSNNAKQVGVWSARYEVTISGVAYQCAR
jgi:Domain of unknown function (DUF4156)